jgi:ABC-type multidrug transport system fused ATPase/permease subunit
MAINLSPKILRSCDTDYLSSSGLIFKLQEEWNAADTSLSRNVAFKYPRSDSARYVLKNVSFKVESGQLCVIVGSNGSGKLRLTVMPCLI